MVLKTLDQFREELLETHAKKKFVTPKHDPFMLSSRSAGVTSSVISFEFIANPEKFVNEYISEVNVYMNFLYGNEYYEVVPSPTCDGYFSSGSTGTRMMVMEGWDRMVCVKGWSKGLHGFGERSREIFNKRRNQQLKYLYKLKH
jgi:hypothetical protein